MHICTPYFVHQSGRLVNGHNDRQWRTLGMVNDRCRQQKENLSTDWDLSSCTDFHRNRIGREERDFGSKIAGSSVK